MTDTIEGRLVGDDESTADNVKYVPSPVRTVFVASGLDREAQARKDEFDLVHQPIAIEFWADMCQALQARICALEAQVAVDAKVREAVGAVPQLLWYEALAYLAGGMRRENVPNRENIDQRLCAAINAALAARKQAE